MEEKNGLTKATARLLRAIEFKLLLFVIFLLVFSAPYFTFLRSYPSGVLVIYYFAAWLALISILFIISRTIDSDEQDDA